MELNTALLPLVLVVVALGLVGLEGTQLASPLGPRPTSHGDSRWAGWRDGRRLGRLALPGRPRGDGVVLGFWGRRRLQSPAEDNVLVFGVQRSGKTSTVVVPTLLAWRGAAIVTSTKHELLRLTAHHRRSLGPVYVFAPLEAPAAITRLGLTAVRWNPLAEASTASRAAELADLFTASGKQGSAVHWYLAAASLLTGLFVQAHLTGGDLRSVLAVLNMTAHGEYTGLAEQAGESPAGEVITAFAKTPEKEAGSIASTARAALGLWLDERVAAATAAAGGEELDIDRLLEQSGSLYLVAPAEDAERCRPLFSALVQAVLRRATARAREQGGVLEPRLLLALDEVANFARIPNLAAYASTGPGQGIQTLLCFHDFAQVEGGYGSEAARTIWNNCRARLLLPGQSDLGTLELFSRSIGEETRTYELARGGRDGGTQRQRVGHALASPDVLRRSEQPVLLYASAPPARLVARRWDQVPAWRRLVESSSPLVGGHVAPPANAGLAGKGGQP